MSEALVLWSHALASLLFAGLTVAAARSGASAVPRRALLAMCALTALWALAVAGFGGADVATRLIDMFRNLAMLALMAAILRARAAPVGTGPIYAIVALVVVLGGSCQIIGVTLGGTVAGAEIAGLAVLLRMMVDVTALVLVHHLNGSGRRGDVALVAWALAVMWAADLALATHAYLSGAWGSWPQVARGIMTAVAGAAVAVAMHRDGRRPVAVSRAVAHRTLALVAIGGYVVLLALATNALSELGARARLWQTAFVFGSATALVTLAASPWLRAWTKVKVAKHLYRHRYDYRNEWLRFTATLAAAGTGVPLAKRVVKAVADLTDSPAGLLLVRDGAGLGVGAGWNWTELPREGAGAALAVHLTASERIVELDPLREGCGGDERDAVPDWMLADMAGWALVPLIHGRDLVGAILLARPALDRALDWEDFDLLKVAGRQVASYLAEAQAQDALAEGARFDEFNRRFAFIVHDIKNLASGIALVARNAERHAENPAFREDMVETLKDSAAKMHALLIRLSAASRPRAAASVAVPLLPFVTRIARARRAAHPIVVEGDADVLAAADPVRLEQIVGHLLLNAIEASDAGVPVTLRIEGQADAAVIAVIDRGRGMSAAFVRDSLFRPFVSSKPTGFGIGAFEAKQLAESMGGHIGIDSREGEGSAFRIVLPRTSEGEMGVAA